MSVIMPFPDGKIYSCICEEYEKKPHWIINQDTFYPCSQFSKDEAIADYQSHESCECRWQSDYSTWCD